MIFQIFGVWIAVATSSVMFLVPRKFVFYCALTGAVGQFIYLISVQGGIDVVISVFIGSMGVALFCHSLARVFKAPVTIFLIPGILPMVPGLSMYRAVYYLITGYRELASYYLAEAIQIAGMIALAIFIMDSVFRVFQRKM